MLQIGSVLQNLHERKQIPRLICIHKLLQENLRKIMKFVFFWLQTVLPDLTR